MKKHAICSRKVVDKCSRDRSGKADAQANNSINISAKNQKRMKQRDNKKKYICYPEDKLKNFWEVAISLSLVVACTTTPVYIAFHESPSDGSMTSWEQMNLVLDFVFGIDIFIVFCSAYHDDEFQMIDDRKLIACNYLRGWFLIDFLAIFPFDQLVQGEAASSEDINGIVRIARLGRMYKLIKLTRLIRIIKLMKQKSNILKFAADLFQLGNGFERIYFFFIFSIMVCHIFACLWVFFSQLA